MIVPACLTIMAVRGLETWLHIIGSMSTEILPLPGCKIVLNNLQAFIFILEMTFETLMTLYKYIQFSSVG